MSSQVMSALGASRARNRHEELDAEPTCHHHRLTLRCYECAPPVSPATLTDEKPGEAAIRQQLAQEYLVLKAVLPQLDDRFTSLANRAREAGLPILARQCAAIAGKLGDL